MKIENIIKKFGEAIDRLADDGCDWNYFTWFQLVTLTIAVQLILWVVSIEDT